MRLPLFALALIVLLPGCEPRVSQPATKPQIRWIDANKAGWLEMTSAEVTVQARACPWVAYPVDLEAGYLHTMFVEPRSGSTWRHNNHGTFYGPEGSDAADDPKAPNPGLRRGALVGLLVGGDLPIRLFRENGSGESIPGADDMRLLSVVFNEQRRECNTNEGHQTVRLYRVKQ